MNQLEEEKKEVVEKKKGEEKNEVVEKKKCLTLNISSCEKEIGESCCDDEDAEMAMLAKRYKKLTFEKNQRMRKWKFKRDRFKGVSSRYNQILCYGCNQPEHLRNECPLNK